MGGAKASPGEGGLGWLTIRFPLTETTFARICVYIYIYILGCICVYNTLPTLPFPDGRQQKRNTTVTTEWCAFLKTKQHNT